MDSNEGLITHSGMFYPKGFIAALVKDPSLVGDVRQGLQAANFDDVRVFSAQEILADVELIKGRQSFFDRIAMSLAEEGSLRDTYLEQIRNGASMVLVRTPSDEHIAAAHALLKASGAQHMVYYGEATMTNLY